MTTTQRFPVHAAMSLATGILFPPADGEGNGFSDMHKLTEHLAGRPVYSHMFGDKEYIGRIAGDSLRRQHPFLAELDVSAFDVAGDRAAMAADIVRAQHELGRGWVYVEKGDGSK